MGETQHIAHHHDNAGPVGRFQHAVGLLQVQGDGLFGEDVFAAGSAVKHHIGAGKRRGTDHYAVSQGQQVVEIRIRGNS